MKKMWLTLHCFLCLPMVSCQWLPQDKPSKESTGIYQTSPTHRLFVPVDSSFSRYPFLKTIKRQVLQKIDSGKLAVYASDSLIHRIKPEKLRTKANYRGHLYRFSWQHHPDSTYPHPEIKAVALTHKQASSAEPPFFLSFTALEKQLSGQALKMLTYLFNQRLMKLYEERPGFMQDSIAFDDANTTLMRIRLKDEAPKKNNIIPVLQQLDTLVKHYYLHNQRITIYKTRKLKDTLPAIDWFKRRNVTQTWEIRKTPDNNSFKLNGEQWRISLTIDSNITSPIDTIDEAVNYWVKLKWTKTGKQLLVRPKPVALAPYIDTQSLDTTHYKPEWSKQEDPSIKIGKHYPGYNSSIFYWVTWPSVKKILPYRKKQGLKNWIYRNITKKHKPNDRK